MKIERLFKCIFFLFVCCLVGGLVLLQPFPGPNIICNHGSLFVRVLLLSAEAKIDSQIAQSYRNRQWAFCLVQNMLNLEKSQELPLES